MATTSSLSGLIMIAVLCIILSCTVGLYVLVAVMAKSRLRNAALWVLVAIVGSPLLAIIILLCIGTDYKNQPPSSNLPPSYNS